MSVAQDGLTVATEKGFRMCRANVGVKEGNWYWEATVQNAQGNKSADGAHVRIGWVRREGKKKSYFWMMTNYLLSRSLLHTKSIFYNNNNDIII